MSDFWIGAIIIFGCLFVFGLMSVLVVDSHNKRQAKQTQAEKDAELAQLKTAADSMMEWSASIKMHDQDAKLKKAVATMVEDKLAKLAIAIDEEDYEAAAELRDEIEELKQELIKFQTNENETK